MSRINWDDVLSDEDDLINRYYLTFLKNNPKLEFIKQRFSRYISYHNNNKLTISFRRSILSRSDAIMIKNNLYLATKIEQDRKCILMSIFILFLIDFVFIVYPGYYNYSLYYGLVLIPILYNLGMLIAVILFHKILIYFFTLCNFLQIFYASLLILTSRWNFLYPKNLSISYYILDIFIKIYINNHLNLIARVL